VKTFGLAFLALLLVVGMFGLAFHLNTIGMLTGFGFCGFVAVCMAVALFVGLMWEL
jgi:hypothetical protein